MPLWRCRKSKPLVWRKVEVPSSLMLSGLHTLIQDTMGWSDSHLHGFRTKDRSFEEGEEFETTVGDLLQKVGDRLTYEYDFGDSWVHKIEVLKVGETIPDDHAIHVLGGKNACPPEDICGPWIYSRMVELWLSGDKKRMKSEFAERAERLLDEDFDPTWFDREEVQEYVEDIFGE